MKLTKTIGATAIACVSTFALGWGTASVDGVDYVCTTSCNVDTSTRPATVTDCCGGKAFKEVETKPKPIE